MTSPTSAEHPQPLLKSSSSVRRLLGVGLALPSIVPCSH
jgi:hypothetical protein